MINSGYIRDGKSGKFRGIWTSAYGPGLTPQAIAALGFPSNQAVAEDLISKGCYRVPGFFKFQGTVDQDGKIKNGAIFEMAPRMLEKGKPEPYPAAKTDTSIKLPMNNYDGDTKW